MLIPEQVAHLTSLASSGVAGGMDDLVEDRDRWRTQADLGGASLAGKLEEMGFRFGCMH